MQLTGQVPGLDQAQAAIASLQSGKSSPVDVGSQGQLRQR